MNYINLTPHAVVVYGQDDQIILTVATSGVVARLSEAVAPNGTHGGVPHTVVTLGTVAGLPEPTGDTTYIASMPLLMGMLAGGINRPDVVYPFGQVRDGQGRIIGCRSLARLAAPAVR